MFIVIHQNDINSLSFINYINERKLECINISLEHLIKEVQIESKLDNVFEEAEWVYNGKKISLRKVTGIYNTTYYPEKDYFLDFKEKDVEYARSEWHAYILYQLSIHKNCLNSITHRQFVGTHLSLLNLYKISSQYDFLAPEYKLVFKEERTLLKNLKEKNFIFKKSIYDHVNYKADDKIKDPSLAIKIYPGAQILCHIINGKIISKIKFHDKEYLFDLEEKIKEKCISMLNTLELKVAEILFLKTKNNKYYLYHVSPHLNWNNMGNEKKLVWDELINTLSGK